MIEAMNHRASIVSGKEATWWREAEFNSLILWTRNVTPPQMVEFRNDRIGETYGKRLFLNVLRN